MTRVYFFSSIFPRMSKPFVLCWSSPVYFIILRQQDSKNIYLNIWLMFQEDRRAPWSKLFGNKVFCIIALNMHDVHKNVKVLEKCNSRKQSNFLKFSIWAYWTTGLPLASSRTNILQVMIFLWQTKAFEHRLLILVVAIGASGQHSPFYRWGN